MPPITPIKKLQKLHESYEEITEWQIKKTRRHARIYGPGFAVTNSPSHQVRLPKAMLDHFIDFVNRPYFQVTMPNVIRTVTRSTYDKSIYSVL
jgi:hypothetical protein